MARRFAAPNISAITPAHDHHARNGLSAIPAPASMPVLNQSDTRHSLALATDYDGTIASDGVVDTLTLAALERLRGGGRCLILVTGRGVTDLQRVMSRLSLFDLVVAENGGLLYNPATRAEQTLKQRAAFVTTGTRGAGVAELIDRVLATDLAEFDVIGRRGPWTFSRDRVASRGVP